MKHFQRIPNSRLVFPASGLVAICAAISQLIGCAVGPKYKTPTSPVPPAYKENENWKVAQPSENKLGGNWWEIFNDPQLNALEQQIDVSNQNLKVAFAQYQEARAALRYTPGPEDFDEIRATFGCRSALVRTPAPGGRSGNLSLTSRAHDHPQRRGRDHRCHTRVPLAAPRRLRAALPSTRRASMSMPFARTRCRSVSA